MYWQQRPAVTSKNSVYAKATTVDVLTGECIGKSIRAIRRSRDASSALRRSRLGGAHECSLLTKSARYLRKRCIRRANLHDCEHIAALRMNLRRLSAGGATSPHVTQAVRREEGQLLAGVSLVG